LALAIQLKINVHEAYEVSITFAADQHDHLAATTANNYYGYNIFAMQLMIIPL